MSEETIVETTVEPLPEVKDAVIENKDKTTETITEPVVTEYAEFVIPDGLNADQEVLTDFKDLAKEMKLTQEQAQKFHDLGAKNVERVTAAFQAQQDAVKAEWREASLSDKEFGGEKFQENMATTKKAFDAYATPELKQLLDQTGLGNHPDMIRVFFKMGKTLNEDNVITGGANGSEGANDPRTLYPNSNMK